MNSKRPHAIYSTLQHIFAEIIHVFHFCRFGFFKRLKSSMEILLDGKNLVNQDENKYITVKCFGLLQSQVDRQLDM